MKKTGLDATDIRILGAIQQNGPLSKSKLAELVNLSPTPCWSRLDKLKKAGLIRGYYADIALELLVDLTRVIVTVSLTKHRKSDFDRFEEHVHNLDEVIECIATGGGTDYVLFAGKLLPEYTHYAQPVRRLCQKRQAAWQTQTTLVSEPRFENPPISMQLYAGAHAHSLCTIICTSRAISVIRKQISGIW